MALFKWGMQTDSSRHRARVSMIVVFGVLAGTASCGAPSSSEETAELQQPFSNATLCRSFMSPELCVLEADHENATRAALSFLKDAVLDRVILHNTLVDANQLSSAAHFDGCSFIPAMRNINDLYERAVEFSDPANLQHVRAQRVFGRLLHRIQDFYSHSNWVELRRVTILPRLVDSEKSMWSAFAGRYRPVGSSDVLVVQGEPPRGLTPVLNSFALPWPDRVLVRFRENDQYGLASGAAGDPNRCPTTVPAHHNQFNKDHTGREGFQEAIELATEQTRHEWCRLVNLVRVTHRIDGDLALYDSWVDDVVSARCGDDADLEAIPDVFPPLTQALVPGQSRVFQFRVRNNGPGEAYGVEWKGVFNGSVSSVTSPTLTANGTTTTCDLSETSATCRFPEVFPPDAMAIIELALEAGTPGMMTLAISASSHSPDPVPQNDRIQPNPTLEVRCASPAPAWNPTSQQCEPATGGSISGTVLKVLDATGTRTPAEGAFVAMCRDEDGDGTCCEDELECLPTETVMRTTADDNGQYQFSELQAGIYIYDAVHWQRRRFVCHELPAIDVLDGQSVTAPTIVAECD